MYSLVVYGATSFTGKLIVEYLQKRLPQLGSEFTWAIAGRNANKLQQVLDDLDLKDVPIIIADSGDYNALLDMARSTKVVLTCVGPYALYGTKVLKACEAVGTHYVDLTGEKVWHHRMISESDPNSKSIIIPSCGFDSLPSDMCAYLAVKALRDRGQYAGKVSSLMSFGGKLSGANVLSGGTFATIIDTAKSATKTRKIAMDPYAISPMKGNQKPSLELIVRSGNRIGSFFFLCPYNTDIVRRSWGLFESGKSSKFSYGPKFEYKEGLAMKNRISALLVSFGLLFAAGLMLIPFIRNLAAKYGPQTGEGPSKESDSGATFRMDTVAESEDGRVVSQCRLDGLGHAGYHTTAVMITECALLLALEHDKLPENVQNGGFYTPATAFGDLIIARLEESGKLKFNTKIVKG